MPYNKRMHEFMESKQKMNIAIVTDYVAPKFGGVETHTY